MIGILSDTRQNGVPERLISLFCKNGYSYGGCKLANP